MLCLIKKSTYYYAYCYQYQEYFSNYSFSVYSQLLDLDL